MISFPSTSDLKLPSVSSTTSEQTANDTNRESKNPEISIVPLSNGKTSKWNLLSRTFSILEPTLEMNMSKEDTLQWEHVGALWLAENFHVLRRSLVKIWEAMPGNGTPQKLEFLLSDKAERFRYHPVKRRSRYFSRNCKMTFSLVVVVVASKFREWYKSIKRSRYMQICPFSHLVIYRKWTTKYHQTTINLIHFSSHPKNRDIVTCALQNSSEGVLLSRG